MENLRATLSCGASYLHVSVVVFVSVAFLLKDPLSAQPCSLWACICGAYQRRLWKRRDQRIRESSQRAAASSAFPCVSHSPWSFQPAHQQPQSQGASIQGEGRCLEDWVGHGTVNRAPPPTCLNAASGPAAEAFICLMFPSFACVCESVCVFFLPLILQLCFAASTLCCVWDRCYPSLLMPLVAPRCWDRERASERGVCGERRGMKAGESTVFLPLLSHPSISSSSWKLGRGWINESCISTHLREGDMHRHFLHAVCAYMFLQVPHMVMKALNCFLQMNTHAHAHRHDIHKSNRTTNNSRKSLQAISISTSQRDQSPNRLPPESSGARYSTPHLHLHLHLQERRGENVVIGN